MSSVHLQVALTGHLFLHRSRLVKLIKVLREHVPTEKNDAVLL